MKKLSKADFKEIQAWMHRNARPLELALWKFHFEGGSRDAVVAALQYYQNADGGFGNALEPDCWNPDSSPYTTLVAINLLRGVGFADMAHPMAQGILRYLESGAHRLERGWDFNIPTNNGFAHAPWWTYDDAANATESIGVTAGLAGFILTHGDRNSTLYAKAMEYAGSLIGRLSEQGQHGDMGVSGYIGLLEDIGLAGLAGRFDCAFLRQRLASLVNGAIERDDSKWLHYCPRPSGFIKSPDSAYYQGNKEIVDRELDYLIETRPAGGVWGITWSWFENNGKYPKEFAISENWWRAAKCIEHLIFLQNFQRLD